MLAVLSFEGIGSCVGGGDAEEGAGGGATATPADEENSNICDIKFRVSGLMRFPMRDGSRSDSVVFSDTVFSLF
jgi:hypothetical protein